MSTQSAQLSRSHRGIDMPQYWLWKKGILHSKGKIPVTGKSEVQEDEVDQMHKEASLLKPHSGWFLYRIGTKGTSSV